LEEAERELEEAKDNAAKAKAAGGPTDDLDKAVEELEAKVKVLREKGGKPKSETSRPVPLEAPDELIKAGIDALNNADAATPRSLKAVADSIAKLEGILKSLPDGVKSVYITTANTRIQEAKAANEEAVKAAKKAVAESATALAAANKKVTDANAATPKDAAAVTKAIAELNSVLVAARTALSLGTNNLPIGEVASLSALITAAEGLVGATVNIKPVAPVTAPKWTAHYIQNYFEWACYFDANSKEIVKEKPAELTIPYAVYNHGSNTIYYTVAETRSNAKRPQEVTDEQIQAVADAAAGAAAAAGISPPQPGEAQAAADLAKKGATVAVKVEPPVKPTDPQTNPQPPSPSKTAVTKPSEWTAHYYEGYNTDNTYYYDTSNDRIEAGNPLTPNTAYAVYNHTDNVIYFIDDKGNSSYVKPDNLQDAMIDAVAASADAAAKKAGIAIPTETDVNKAAEDVKAISTSAKELSAAIADYRADNTNAREPRDRLTAAYSTAQSLFNNVNDKGVYKAVFDPLFQQIKDMTTPAASAAAAGGAGGGGAGGAGGGGAGGGAAAVAAAAAPPPAASLPEWTAHHDDKYTPPEFFYNATTRAIQIAYPPKIGIPYAIYDHNIKDPSKAIYYGTDSKGASTAIMPSGITDQIIQNLNEVVASNEFKTAFAAAKGTILQYRPPMIQAPGPQKRTRRASRARK
jgi:predicted translin family RNA/ssDNA-binding protein